MLMIGKEGPGKGTAETRWLNVVKNKMPFGPRVQKDMSHGNFGVSIDTERGQYHSNTFKTRTLP